MATTLKLEKKVFFQGVLQLRTGMHIGGSSLGLAIGGADKVVVRNPVTKRPYTPGSSLKGKLRSLLEKSHDLVVIETKEKNGKTEWHGPLCTNPAQPLVQLFGFPAEETTNPNVKLLAPTRLTVRDGDLLNIEEIERAGETDMYGTEIKTEVNIDRLTSAANPRNFERVPAGAKFAFQMVVDIYNVDTASDANGSNYAKQYMMMLREGLRLMENDYIGGQGSRGYGQVEVKLGSVIERTAEDYRADTLEDRPSEYAEMFNEFMQAQEVSA